MRALPALLLVAALAGAQDDNRLDAPLESPLAKRKRDEAAGEAAKGLAVHEAVRQGNKPSPEALREAIAALEEAVDLYERAQEMEWSMQANVDELRCVKSWLALRGLLPEEKEPADEKAKKEREKESRENVRDARRFLTKVLRLRRYRKVFERCSRCDGRGELTSAFGDRSTCPSCRGAKQQTDRKTLLRGYWFAHSPFFRADARERSTIDYVLRSGVRGAKRLTPYIATVSVEDVEDHGWWFRIKTEEKVIEDVEKGERVEREHAYVVVKVGRTFWIHGGSPDRDLLRVPEG